MLPRDLQESSTASKLTPKSPPKRAAPGLETDALRTQQLAHRIPEIRPRLDPVRIRLVRSLVLSGLGGGLCAKLAKPTIINR